MISTRLSGGQQQRLSIALAVVNDPELVFLDEPTTGLDPQARLSLWEAIERIRARGRTVVLTTHYMEEAERLCDRVAIIDRGKIVALDTPARLIARYSPATTIEFRNGAGLKDSDLRAIAEIDALEFRGDLVRIQTRHPAKVLAVLFDRTNVVAGDLRVDPGSLEDAFLSLTGRQLRQ